MVCLQCKTCVIHILERFRRELLASKSIFRLLTFHKSNYDALQPKEINKKQAKMLKDMKIIKITNIFVTVFNFKLVYIHDLIR